jgi:hypothetical protein
MPQTFLFDDGKIELFADSLPFAACSDAFNYFQNLNYNKFIGSIST